MGRMLKSKILCSLLIGLILVVGAHGQITWAEEDQEVQRQLTELKNTVDKLKEEIPKIGFINRQKVFSVFSQMAQQKREKVQDIKKDMNELNAQAQEEEISESKYKRERDLLQTKYVKAKIEVDLSILGSMIKAKGFSEISDQLGKLKQQTEPMEKSITDLLKGIENQTISPQQVSNTLKEVDQQYKQLDDILTNLAHSKITQVAQKIAKEKSYDLVIEQQEVILYTGKDLIDDLTEEVRERVKDEFQSE